jgi:hypothetical protein
MTTEKKFSMPTEIAIVMTLLAIVVWEPSKSTFKDLLLKIGGTHTNGEITVWDEEASDGDHGQTLWSHTAGYVFRDSSGREFRGHVSGEGRIPGVFRNKSAQIFVEYLPRYPTINRLRLKPQPQNWSEIAPRLTLTLIFWIFFAATFMALAMKKIREFKSRNRTTRG